MSKLLAVFAASVAGVVVIAITCVRLPSAEEPAPSGKSPAARSSAKKAAIGRVHAHDAQAKLKFPRWWKAGDPVPQVKSNCVRCHLTAERELTAPVQDFARSVHDLHGMTCSDCHGGNRENDAEAHEVQFGFIGTKLSAHMAGCADCHSDQAEQVKAGPHYWDFSKKINLKYPVCIDCHGQHDVEKPPAEFALMTVCTECHQRFDKEMPVVASVVAENDRLWATLRRVQEKNIKSEQPIPQKFQQDLANARQLTASLIHPAKKITPKDADEINAQVTKIRSRLEAWLADKK